MAKKQDDGPITRVLREQIGGGFLTIGDGAFGVGIFPGYQVTDDTTAVLVHQLNQYFDLQGYALRDLTTYIQAALFQKIGRYDFEGMQAGANIEEIIIVSTVPLSITKDFTVNALADSVPGNLTSNTSLQDIVSCTQIVYAQDAGAGFGRPIQSNTWGVGDSTAADRLYFSRFFKFPKTKHSGAGGGNATYGFEWPEVGVVVPIVVAKEQDLEYIMRLARSVRTYEPV
jgi:hypothetical protein